MTEKNISEKVSTTYVAPTGHCTIYMMTEKNRREKDPFPTSSQALKRGGKIVHALKCTPRVSSLTEVSFLCITAESRHTPPFFELRTLEPPVALKASVYF